LEISRSSVPVPASAISFDHLLREHPTDAEISWRLARALADKHEWWQAMEQHKRTLDLQGSDMLRSDTMVCLSGLEQNERLSWLLRAAAETPYRREPWYELARYHYERSEWHMCYGYIGRALAIEQPMLHETDNPGAWGAHAYDMGSFSAWQIGEKQASLRWARRAAELAPDDVRLKENLVVLARLLGEEV
jgi:tetratricopeptide (TPR) repeat protein